MPADSSAPATSIKPASRACVPPVCLSCEAVANTYQEQPKFAHLRIPRRGQAGLRDLTWRPGFSASLHPATFADQARWQPRFPQLRSCFIGVQIRHSGREEVRRFAHSDFQVVISRNAQRVRYSQLSVVVSLFFELHSLISFLGNSPRSACNEGAFSLGFSLSQAERTKFPVKFPVSSEFQWRFGCAPLHRQPSSPIFSGFSEEIAKRPQIAGFVHSAFASARPFYGHRQLKC
jgi:hypothetical protein